jgi:hypothetical protein
MKIMIAIPSATGKIPLSVMSRLIQLDKPEDSIVNFGYVSRLMIDKARNGMVSQCLMHDNDYLFFCDDDQIPCKDILVKMVALDKDIVGCPIPSRNGKKELAVYDMDFNRINEIKETQRVGGVGMASTLIKSKALKKIIKEYPAPFQFENAIEMVDGKEILVEFSEDINFCRRAGELGLEVWCMADVYSKHIGEPVTYWYDKDFKNNINENS